MNLTEEYKLSTYSDERVIKESDLCTVSLVTSTVDGKKYIKKEYADNKNNVFTLLQKINCPYLPEIKDIIDGRIIIEEYVDGVILEQKITENSLNENQRKKIFKQLLSALDILHKNGIVHRDVKLSNIIIKNDGTAVLVDFGISKLYNENSDKDTSLLGTVGYAPPEQFGFASTDFRSDVYSFGVTVEKLGLNSYKKVVSRCKEFDPKNRYANAGEVLKAIKQQAIGKAVLSIVLIVAVLVFCFIFKSGTDKTTTSSQESTTQTTQQTTAPTTDIQASTTQSESQSESITEQTTSVSATVENTQNITPVLYGHDKNYRLIETDEEIPSILILQKEYESNQVNVPLSEDIEITVKYTWEDYLIKLDLSDGNTDFSVEYAAADITMHPEYIADGDDVEIIFYDINGDGIAEIIPMICHRDIEVKNGEIIKKINSWEGYCIVYDGKEFYQCKESIKVYGSECDRIVLKDNIFYVDDMQYRYIIRNGTIAKVEA